MWRIGKLDESFNGSLGRRWMGVRRNAPKCNSRQHGVSMQARIKPRCECSRTRWEGYALRCPSGSLGQEFFPDVTQAASMTRTSDSGLVRNHSSSYSCPQRGQESVSPVGLSALIVLSWQAFNSSCKNRVWSFTLNWSKCSGLGAVESCCAARARNSWLASSQTTYSALYLDL